MRPAVRLVLLSAALLVALLVAVEIVVRAMTRAPESTQSAAAMDYKTEP